MSTMCASGIMPSVGASIGVLLSSLAVACWANEQGTRRLTLIADGKAKATIVTGSHPSDQERRAAQELQTYIWKMTSGNGRNAEKLPIRTDRDTPGGTRVFVGRSRHIKEMGIHLDDLSANGFTIQMVSDDLVLCGKDDLGTAFAVYTFIEKYCGVRWLWPGELGEHVPCRQAIEVDAICDRQSPHFELRSLGKDPDWRMKNKLVGGMKSVGGHNWGKMVPPAKYGPEHPEYFAIVNGTRKRNWDGYDGQHGYQLCTTNPEVVRICVDHVRRFFDEHPDVDMYSVAANDGAGWCECDRCRALDPQQESAGGGRILTDRVYTFTNQIAEQLKKTHPGKYVVQLAYQACLEPPKTVRPLDNVVVMLTVNLEGNYAPKHKANHWRIFRAWSKVAPHLYVYEYFMHTWKLQLPRAMPRAIGEALPFYRRCGSSLFYAQSMNDFATEGLDYYIAAKLLWDTNLNVDAIVDDYCEKAFGNAAPVMKTYFRRLEELWAAIMQTRDRWEHGSGHWAGNPDNYLVMFTPEVMRELKGYLTKGLNLAEAGKPQDRVLFMLKGWRFTELEVEAFRSLRELSSKGIIDYRKDAPSWRGKCVGDLSSLDITRQEAEALVEHAISAWKQRDRYVAGLKGSYVIDYDHIKGWNCIDYSFHPVARLKKALARQ